MSQKPAFTAWIVGGAITGLMAAIELAALCRRLKVAVSIRLIEADAFGGGRADRTSSPRCQLWCHRLGTLYATTQPAVSLALQRSTRRLRRLAPHAFRWPLALAIELPGTIVPADHYFTALDIWHRAVSPAMLKTWLPQARLPAGSRVWRVRDGVIDLPLLSSALLSHVRRAGVELIREQVGSLDQDGKRIVGLRLLHGETITVGPHDTVVLACGAHLRPLLSRAGLAIPGLRLYRSHLVASDRCDIPSLLAVLNGGVNCVPHEQSSGRLVNLFGNSGRSDLSPESDGEPLPADPAAIERICAEVEEQLGIVIPREGRLAWPAVKTEIVLEGQRSQAHHAHLVPGLANAWLAVPGKLSQTAACAQDLAIRIVRRSLDESLAMPVWEREMDRAVSASKQPCAA